MFYKYPYTNLYNLNLDWLIQAVKEVQDIVEPLNRIVNSVNGMTGDVVLTKALLTQILGSMVESFNGRSGAVQLTADDVNATLIDITWTSDPGDSINDLTQAQLDAMYVSGFRVLIFVNNLGVADQVYFLQWYDEHAQPQAYTPTSALAGVVSVNGMSGTVTLTAEGIPSSVDGQTTVKEVLEELDENKADVIITESSGAIASFDDGADNLPVEQLTVNIEPVQKGAGDPSPENIRPITGWTGVKVTRAVVNLLDKTKAAENERFLSTGIGPELNNCRSEYIQIKPNTAYYFKNVRGYYITPIFWYDKDKNYIGNSNVGTTDPSSGVATSPENAAYVGVNFVPNYLNSVAVNYPATETEYKPYQGQPYEITFPSEAGTVYGGTLDVTTGALTVNRAVIASYNGETLPGEWISDRDVYAPGTTPTTGAQVVYTLAEPLTYNLTPTEIRTLLGQNNIWADTGNVDVSYRADTKTYVDQHIAELGPVNNLTSDSTTAALAAAQGKALNQQITEIKTRNTTVLNQTKGLTVGLIERNKTYCIDITGVLTSDLTEGTPTPIATHSQVAHLNIINYVRGLEFNSGINVQMYDDGTNVYITPMSTIATNQPFKIDFMGC